MFIVFEVKASQVTTYMGNAVRRAAADDVFGCNEFCVVFSPRRVLG